MAASTSARDSKHMRATTAFIVETLALLAVLVVSIAVFTLLFSRATTTADQSSRLCRAVVVAENAAEEFSADPVAVTGGETVAAGAATSGEDGFAVSCEVTADERDSGTLFRAHIEVSDDAGVAYELDTARFVSEVK